MSMVRLNITLPEDLARQLDELVNPREKSRFIAESLKEKIQRLQEGELQKLLEEGYKARKDESLFLSKEFEAADLEGWDDD